MNYTVSTRTQVVTQHRQANVANRQVNTTTHSRFVSFPRRVNDRLRVEIEQIAAPTATAVEQVCTTGSLTTQIPKTYLWLFLS